MFKLNRTSHFAKVAPLALAALALIVAGIAATLPDLSPAIVLFGGFAAGMGVTVAAIGIRR